MYFFQLQNVIVQTAVQQYLRLPIHQYLVQVAQQQVKQNGCEPMLTS